MMSSTNIRLRIQSLRLADMVMEGTFFLMQIYLTDVWKLNFTTASAFLNIWGGTYRILPLFFIYLADMYVGNFRTLALSGIFSTTGLFLITASALPVYRCEHKEVADCLGDTEKGLFITGMVLIALGRAARFASAQPFTRQQESGQDQRATLAVSRIVFLILFSATAVLVNVAFPYAKKWYLLFGVSAIYTASATVFFFSGYGAYEKYGPTAEQFPITDVYRVFVATAFKISQPYPEDRTQLHGMDESQEYFSSPTFMRFLYKAAIKLPHEETEQGGVDRWSWRLCSVSQVEFTIAVIRLIPFLSSFIMCGVVSSTGSTYFVEQIGYMEYKIGAWEPPAQVLMSLFLLSTLFLGEDRLGRVMGFRARVLGYRIFGSMAMVFSILCCTVAAAVERRRLHVGRRHDLLDQLPAAKIPMNAGWLLFQVVFLAFQEPCMVIALTDFHVRHTHMGLRAFQNCMIEGVTGIGFMCSALVVYAVGKISETGGNPNWFQATLNKSRLDRYYWVLAGLSSVNLLVYFVTTTCYSHREWEWEDGETDAAAAHADEHAIADEGAF